MLLQYKRLEKQIQNLEEQIRTLPSGHLNCAGNGNHIKWYHFDCHKKTYIPKKEHALAEKLALKKYLSLLLEDLLQEQKAIAFYLSQHSDISKANQLLNDSKYNALLAPVFTPLSQELSEWINISYERTPKHPELLLHKSSSGNLVRSKSESLIDTLLYLNKIPFRYECALQLGEVTLFPDFTIRHPKTGATFYWEHFGLMHYPTYSQNVFSKLQLYASHGIIPSIQLITTYETKENPLNADMIEKIITYYFG